MLDGRSKQSGGASTRSPFVKTGSNPSVGSVCAGIHGLRNTIVASDRLLCTRLSARAPEPVAGPGLLVDIATRLTRVATRREEERFVSFDNDPSPVCPPGQAVVEKKKRTRQSLTRVGLYEYGGMRFTKSEVTEIDLTQV